MSKSGLIPLDYFCPVSSDAAIEILNHQQSGRWTDFRHDGILSIKCSLIDRNPSIA